ncbi:Hypothetical protein NTJ_11054 [Nesidiocoris tenuis]|uniref:BHLH domain-containing protein n=1 Tax=Nesidiocoris tenuis TaxID=355587 RepID=A0ABN7B311_9HEMI|nr:Hypothetical protein NTJ_11054 [Nesidiocoris tenuis]
MYVEKERRHLNRNVRALALDLRTTRRLGRATAANKLRAQQPWLVSRRKRPTPGTAATHSTTPRPSTSFVIMVSWSRAHF